MKVNISKAFDTLSWSFLIKVLKAFGFTVGTLTVAWQKCYKCCRPTEEGGLGMRSIKTLNEASNLKHCWDMLRSDDHWAKLLREKF